MLFWFMKKSGDSRQVAKDRLKMVLVNDRMNIRLLENIKYDII
ncbi:MAG: cell division topological specificity factor MinE, partial [Firmicutes bacterium]|nr:cell division topological specificity factor MinE [Bacillota bacterium]